MESRGIILGKRFPKRLTALLLKKGQGIYAFVILKSALEKTENPKKPFREIEPIATPDKIHFADALPKIRSGKISRKIAELISRA